MLDSVHENVSADVTKHALITWRKSIVSRKNRFSSMGMKIIKSTWFVSEPVR